MMHQATPSEGKWAGLFATKKVNGNRGFILDAEGPHIQITDRDEAVLNRFKDAVGAGSVEVAGDGFRYIACTEETEGVMDVLAPVLRRSSLPLTIYGERMDVETPMLPLTMTLLRLGMIPFHQCAGTCHPGTATVHLLEGDADAILGAIAFHDDAAHLDRSRWAVQTEGDPADMKTEKIQMIRFPVEQLGEVTRLVRQNC